MAWWMFCCTQSRVVGSACAGPAVWSPSRPVRIMWPHCLQWLMCACLDWVLFGALTSSLVTHCGLPGGYSGAWIIGSCIGRFFTN